MISPIFIDAKNGHVSRISAFDGSLEKIRELIGCQWITIADLPSGDSIILDDEGLINGQENYFVFEGCNQPFAGNALVVGPSDDDGNSTNPKSTPEQVFESVIFVPREAFKQEYLDELATPKVMHFDSNEELFRYLKTGELK